MSTHALWKIHLHAMHEATTVQSAEVIAAINSAILHACEQTFSRLSDGQSFLTIEGRGPADTGKTISMRKTFQITAVPRRLSEECYPTAEEAIEALRAARSEGRPNSGRYIVVKEPDGSFFAAEQRWESCEFDSSVEAEDALQAFEDPSGYQIIPVVVLDFD